MPRDLLDEAGIAPRDLLAEAGVQPQNDYSPTASAADFIVGNLGRGLTAGAGQLIDTPINLAKAGYGAARVAAAENNAVPAFGRLLGMKLKGETPAQAATAAPELSNPVSDALFHAPSYLLSKEKGEEMRRKMDAAIAPSNKTGEYVQRALQFAGGSLVGGPGNMLRNAATAGAAGVTSKAAEDLLPDSNVAPIAGALLPGGLQMAARGIRNAKPQTPLKEMAQSANENGYKTIPSEVNPGAMNVAESFAGKASMRQSTSLANQKNTNPLIENDIREAAVPAGVKVPQGQLTEQALKQVRDHAGGVYQEVKNHPEMMLATNTYLEGLQSLAGDIQQAAKEFPDLIRNEKIDSMIKSLSKEEMTPTAAVEVSKDLRFKSKMNLKAFDDPEKRALGLAQRKAAGLVEDLIASNLETGGKAKLAARWEASRKLIAKVHDAESAITGRGDFDARVYGSLLDNGKPLSGGAAKVGKFARDFPNAVQLPEKFGSPNVSALKAATSAAFGAAGAAVAIPAAAMAALPFVAPHVIRAHLLSKGHQKTISGKGLPVDPRAAAIAALLTSGSAASKEAN